MKVALCTPSRSGYPHYEHSFSAGETLEVSSKMGVDLRRYVLPGHSIIPYARNYLVAKALHEKCDYIFFVDDDIAWKPKDFFKLIEWGVDVVAAAPAKRHKRWDEQPNCAVRFPPGNKMVQHKNPHGRLWEVLGLATAFMCIKASVFGELESLTRQYFTEDDGSDEFPIRSWFWLDIAEINGRPMGQGEDYNFCRKWSEAGGELFLDPDVRLRHYDGGVCFDICPADFELKPNEAVNG